MKRPLLNKMEAVQQNLQRLVTEVEQMKPTLNMLSSINAELVVDRVGGCVVGQLGRSLPRGNEERTHRLLVAWRVPFGDERIGGVGQHRRHGRRWRRAWRCVGALVHNRLLQTQTTWFDGWLNGRELRGRVHYFEKVVPFVLTLV